METACESFKYLSWDIESGVVHEDANEVIDNNRIRIMRLLLLDNHIHPHPHSHPHHAVIAIIKCSC